MPKAVEARRSKFSPEGIAKMQELARMIGAETYGERPPLITTWAEIEDSGHEIGNGWHLVPYRLWHTESARTAIRLGIQPVFTFFTRR